MTYIMQDFEGVQFFSIQFQFENESFCPLFDNSFVITLMRKTHKEKP